MATTHTQQEQDGAEPQYTCFTVEQAVSEARSALAVCRLTEADREDCYRTLELCRNEYARRLRVAVEAMERVV